MIRIKPDKGIKILALDDDAVVREYIKKSLDSDFTVRYVPDVASFREIITSFRPHIFLLDINLPDGNGIELCESLREMPEYEDSFFIILTSRTDNETIEEAYSKGADDYLRKPFNRYELKSKIKILQHIIEVRENLKNSFQDQLDHNVQLYKLSDHIKKTLTFTNSDSILRNSEALAGIIDCSYCELIKVRKGLPLSILQKQYSPSFTPLPFRELSGIKGFGPLRDQSASYLQIKKGEKNIFICLISLTVRNRVCGHILLQRNSKFNTNEREIISLYLDFLNLINDSLSAKNELQEINLGYKNEINIIRKLELNKFPDFREVEEYDISFSFMPALELSGDFFDGFFIDEDTYQIVLCDVSGHGIASSYVGNQIRTLFRTKSVSGKRPSDIAREVNAELLRDMDGTPFYCTAQIVQLFLGSGEIIFLSAGHPAAVLYRNSGHDISTTTNRSAAIGLFETGEYSDELLTLEEDDFLFLYTDGLTEEINAETEEMFGTGRLIESFRKTEGMTAVEIIHHTLGNFYEYNGYQPQNDDITIICIRKNPDPF